MVVTLLATNVADRGLGDDHSLKPRGHVDQLRHDRHDNRRADIAVNVDFDQQLIFDQPNSGNNSQLYRRRPPRLVVRLRPAPLLLCDFDCSNSLGTVSRVIGGGVWVPGGPPGLQNQRAACRVAGGFDSRPPPPPALTVGVVRPGHSLPAAVPAIAGQVGHVMGTRAHDDALSTSFATASAAALCASASMCV